MKIQIFKNATGLIHGGDPKRISCDTEGVLKIGTFELSVSVNDTIMPLLFHGCTGDYNATFTDMAGKVYELEKVAVREGRIAPPPTTAVEIMELKCRMEEKDRECDELREQISELRNIFDTNSLNFLIQ